MADANFAQSNNPKNSRRRRHLRNTRVDLTAMVDLGFLLITFLCWHQRLIKQKS